MEFNVLVVVPDAKEPTYGGDMHTVKVYKRKSPALKFAKKISKLETFNGHEVYEIYVNAYDENEDENFTWFLKNGEITHSDCG